MTESDLIELNTAQAKPPQISSFIPHILQTAAECFDQI